MANESLGEQVAGMRGEMNAHFSHILATQKTISAALDSHKAATTKEFDDVHARVNRHESKISSIETDVEVIKTNSGKKISITAAGIAGLGLLVAVADRLPW